ncbi:hypothetical protein [Trinickia sp. Y13]|uniref:TubC N-terminal docking domain-related protein n=1 Tax=Trinickia sp. Y13 TaxID=2917807 RepID=UPI00240723D7|nr:hypothetical protein [Trinickia sp. Y13]MDG0025952.1 hypothetical protein [Trinickia sp. Y13]
MSVAQLLSRAAAMGVTLRLDGDAVKVGGPRAAREEIRPELAAHKPEIVAHLRAAANDANAIPADCVGALRDPDGGLYLPWGPCLSIDDLRRMRAELVAMTEELCSLECWPKRYREDVLSRAICGPLADLMPNLAYFNERLSEARAEAAARVAMK